MAQDPASAADAESVVAFLAEAAAPARRDAGDENPVSYLERRDGRALFDDRAHRFVAEDGAGLDLGTSPLRMWRSVPQIVVESIFTIASVASTTPGSDTESHERWPGP
jgi:hypothetical protein